MKPFNIKNWLEDFKDSWTNKDIDGLLCLYSDNVEYYESPYQKLIGQEKIREVWQEIINQENIEIELDLYCTENNRHAVKWKLNFTQNNQRFDCSGTYLIEIDMDNKCCFFYQCTVNQ